jgi:hypothetical protein
MKKCKTLVILLYHEFSCPILSEIFSPCTIPIKRQGGLLTKNVWVATNLFFDILIVADDNDSITEVF